jgi:hypothetical protein
VERTRPQTSLVTGFLRSNRNLVSWNHFLTGNLKLTSPRKRRCWPELPVHSPLSLWCQALERRYSSPPTFDSAQPFFNTHALFTTTVPIQLVIKPVFVGDGLPGGINCGAFGSTVLATLQSKFGGVDLDRCPHQNGRAIPHSARQR